MYCLGHLQTIHCLIEQVDLKVNSVEITNRIHLLSLMLYKLVAEQESQRQSGMLREQELAKEKRKLWRAMINHLLKRHGT